MRLLREPICKLRRSEKKASVSRCLEGASSGAPMRASGNWPSRDGVMGEGEMGFAVAQFTAPLLQLFQKESYQPPIAPAVPATAPVARGSMPLREKVLRLPLGRPRLAPLNERSCATSSTRNCVKPMLAVLEPRLPLKERL